MTSTAILNFQKFEILTDNVRHRAKIGSDW